MQVQIIHDQTKKLSGNLQAGRSKAGRLSKRLVIVCHGYKSSSDHPALSAITNGLHRKGHATFTFNFSSSESLDIESQVADIADIMAHFKQYDEFVLLAASFGALTASIAMTSIPGVSGLVTINGFFGKGALGPKHRNTFRLFRASAAVVPKQRKIWKYFRRGLRPRDITAPVLVIHADTDEIVYPKQSEQFYKQLAGPKLFVHLTGSDHNISQPADVAVVVNAVDHWLATLREDD